VNLWLIAKSGILYKKDEIQEKHQEINKDFFVFSEMYGEKEILSSHTFLKCIPAGFIVFYTKFSTPFHV